MQVRRKDVDRYIPDRSLVTCQVRVRWVGDVNKPVPLHYEIKLDGAKDVFTFLTVTSPIHYGTFPSVDTSTELFVCAI